MITAAAIRTTRIQIWLGAEEAGSLWLKNVSSFQLSEAPPKEETPLGVSEPEVSAAPDAPPFSPDAPASLEAACEAEAVLFAGITGLGTAPAPGAPTLLAAFGTEMTGGGVKLPAPLELPVLSTPGTCVLTGTSAPIAFSNAIRAFSISSGVASARPFSSWICWRAACNAA